MSKEFSISSRDHHQTMLDEIHGGVTPRRCLPNLFGDMLGPEDHFRDGAITFTVEMAIDRLDHVSRTARLLSG